jgi:hypothetical protein
MFWKWLFEYGPEKTRPNTEVEMEATLVSVRALDPIHVIPPRHRHPTDLRSTFNPGEKCQPP